MSEVKQAATSAMLWTTFQGLMLGSTIGAAIVGHHISAAIFVVQCVLFVGTGVFNYRVMARAADKASR